MNKKKPKISIVIPVYNVEKYIHACLDSVISQTINQIEIICINDCTQDRSREILELYAANDHRFVIIDHDRNKGLSAARNTGLAVSKGDYVLFLDSDDFLACDEALEILYSAAKKDDSEETIGGILKWREETNEKYLDWHENYLKKEIHALPLTKLPQLFSNVIAVNKLLKKAFLKQHNIYFDEKIRKNEDNPFSCKVHILSKRITIILKTTYIYRQRDAGTIMSTVKKSDAMNRCAYCYEIFKFIEESSERHVFRKMYYPMYSRQLLSSAGILDGFSPTEGEKTRIIDQWEKIANLLPDHLPAVPSDQKEILRNVKSGKRKIAWEMAINLSKPLCSHSVEKIDQKEHNCKSIIQDFVEQKKLNILLASQIQAVLNSTSWQITVPLRWIIWKIRGF